MSVSGNGQPIPPSELPRFRWSAEVEELQTMAPTLHVDPGPLGRCDSTNVDFSPVYECSSFLLVSPRNLIAYFCVQGFLAVMWTQPKDLRTMLTKQRERYSSLGQNQVQ
jgi:hypothetical protein